MDNLHLSYLSLLSEVAGVLEQLSQLAQQKTAAVRKDDLATLDGILKQEQAKALALRGMEQKRLDMLSRLELSHVPLRELAAHYPQELRVQAKQTAEALQQQYQLYQGAAQAARNTLECNLHQIEKILEAQGAAAPGAGYGQPDVEPPPSMKTDFRA